MFTMGNGVQVLTMGRLRNETDKDEELAKVRELVGSGAEWPQELDHWRRSRRSLGVVDGVVVYGDRVVVPRGLR